MMQNDRLAYTAYIEKQEVKNATNTWATQER